MRKILGLALLGTVMASPAWAEQSLYVAYPPTNHQTTSDRIFIVGSAPSTGDVLVNGNPISRSKAGNFAPSFPLQLGENSFTLSYQNQQVQIKITRLSTQQNLPVGLGFAKDSLTPTVDIAKMPGELICFGAIAPPNATVSVKLGNQIIPLLPQSQDVQLPPNSAILTDTNQPTPPTPPYQGGANQDTPPYQGGVRRGTGQYQGCAKADSSAEFGTPLFQLTLNGKITTQPGSGKISILSPVNLEEAEVTSNAGVARTGPGTDFSRITPLPKGTRASVTAKEGEWIRLDYGGWIKASEVRIVASGVPPRSIIRSVRARQVEGATEVIFPLQVPVPLSVQQGDRTFTVTLYNTTAQTDTIRLDDDPIISRLDWQQVAPGQVQYAFNLKTQQQWGYTLKYEGTSLILSLRHPPKVSTVKSLSGIKILLDPGHGGPEDSGSVGPTGYPEKAVALTVSKLVREQLVQRGAIVYMTREEDKDVGLQERVDMIEKTQPALSISLHYNALPDNGDAMNTKGIGTFWYNPQAHSFAVFMHNYLVEKLRRPSYGVFWNNLALTRPHITPSVLLELGFMINPEEFEWVSNPQEQQKLAEAIANGITEWFLAAK